jgi:hypothetical protein
MKMLRTFAYDCFLLFTAFVLIHWLHFDLMRVLVVLLLANVLLIATNLVLRAIASRRTQ